MQTYQNEPSAAYADPKAGGVDAPSKFPGGMGVSPRIPVAWASCPRFPRVFAAAALSCFLSACGPFLEVNIMPVGERTSLENQVLGSYKSLSADFESFGSVRGVDEFGQIKTPPAVTDSKRAAILAMQNRAYNRDDVVTFLTSGLAGEDNRGLLALFDDALAAQPAEQHAFIKSVIDEENRDRETLIQRLMATTPGIGPDDESRVRSVFASLNRDIAPAGARVQMEDGTWTSK